MEGFPKIMNTKEDYEYVREHFPQEQWKPSWQALLDTVSDWFFVRDIAEGETAPVGDNYKVVEDKNEDTGVVRARSLYEYKENPNCRLYRLGFTKQEVEEALGA